MDTFKEIVSFLGAIVGFVTALVTLYAFYVDRKNRREAEPRSPAPFADSPPLPPAWQPAPRPAAKAAVAVLDVLPVLPAYPKTTERAKQLVRAPAITMICIGFLALGFDLLVAVWGFVDAFVTPLNNDQPTYHANPYGAYPAPYSRAPMAAPPRKSDAEKATTLLTCFTLLSFALASTIAIWAGFNMVRLRSCWLSVAGSCAIMPGACFCCLAGLPIGVWSLTVLMKSEVSSAFS